MDEVLIRLIFGYLKKLNRDKALKRGEEIGTLLYRLGYRKDVIKKNLDIAFPQKDDEWKRYIALESLKNLGRVLAELPKLPEYLKTGEIKSIFRIRSGDELLEKYRDEGFILLTGHLGNWEIINIGLSYHGYRMSALAYRQRNRKINRIIEEIRTSAGSQIIYHDQPMRKFINALNSKRIISFLVDQNTLRHRGVFVDFFGEKASTVFFPAKVALKYKKPVLFCYSVFDKETKNYQFFVKEVKTDDLTEKDVPVLVQRYTYEVENAVREYPEQYMWTHKRWKTRPEGEPENIY
ncbi:MAG TPA: lipid A biosynthesis acyltransferase [Persephonella sp.]|uniref:Putative lipid A biosynthesis acyltransferase n=1 Tax=Persephonella marina (strain DSM 14350 / EX-H1) TaxID=123214 RepID=C0QQ97_PERMH|nr:MULTISPECIES: lysophospholipid acyltransferase family protein [Persephonella]ACO03368.1 putative lipid A biosynthesis acyltransferase [Persephonella marina EX-H1]HCB69551.1 lipid A biosynthesis acyltransferase [Persephonella sp.]